MIMRVCLICLLILTSGVTVLAGGRPEGNADISAMSFAQLEEVARGSSLRFAMWGGSAQINGWVDSVVAKHLHDRYDISLVRVPLDASVFVNRLLSEKTYGRDVGVLDILWINGENFKNAREGDILFGPFTQLLPHLDYVDPATTLSDAGYSVEGYEAPYGRAQFVMEYDSAKVLNPPSNYDELAVWVRQNPGRFTYPQPPDFTGSAFIRQAFYVLSGGHEQYLDGFDPDLFERNVIQLWDYLNAIEPYLWRKGETYPTDLATLDGLFERGETAFNMTFTQTGAANKIAQGRYPASVRTFVFENASLANTHYLAIPFNSPNKAGAVVAINSILSPEMQLSKNDPQNWGDFTVLDVQKLPATLRQSFADLDLGEATLSLDQLSHNAVSEIPSQYIEALERGWEEHVLRN